jgi:hypothetical protein
MSACSLFSVNDKEGLCAIRKPFIKNKSRLVVLQEKA